MSKDEPWIEPVNLTRRACRPCLPLIPTNLSHLQVLLSGLEWLQMVPMPPEAHRTLRRMAHALDELLECVAAARETYRAQRGGISAGSRFPRR